MKVHYLPEVESYLFELIELLYKANNYTTWYIFFQQKADIYLIRYITNNQVAAHHF
jgi:hypothetical protein